MFVQRNSSPVAVRDTTYADPHTHRYARTVISLGSEAHPSLAWSQVIPVIRSTGSG